MLDPGADWSSLNNLSRLVLQTLDGRSHASDEVDSLHIIWGVHQGLMNCD